MAKPPEILLLSDASAQINSWTRMLTGTTMRLWQGVAAISSDTALDVIVTDRNVSCDMLPDSRSCSRLACGEIGMIRIGEDGTADVRLPPNVTPRELQLACLLLSEVVRLRRQCNRERRIQRTLSELVMRDPLTGLPNRRAWQDRLAGWASVLDADLPGRCVAVLDLDHFKSVNERFGHLTGDRVLRQVAERLAESLAEGIFAARLGGDEFGLLFTGSNPSMVANRMERLRVGCCADIDPSISASVGLAFGEPGEFLNADELFEAADEALRQAKSAGRDRTVAAPPRHSIAPPVRV
jgi:diguanylate cyclase (GGDEF)-like protein